MGIRGLQIAAWPQVGSPIEFYSMMIFGRDRDCYPRLRRQVAVRLRGQFDRTALQSMAHSGMHGLTWCQQTYGAGTRTCLIRNMEGVLST
jgi:hypothetical protein